MINRALLRALSVTCALFVVDGCKTNTAKDANWKPEVVLEEGMEPQLPLRYAIAEGSTTTSTMQVSVSSMTTTTSEGEAFTNAPRLRFVISTGPAMKLPNGNTRLNVEIVDAQAIMPDGAVSEIQSDYEKSASLLRDVGGWIEVDDRGIVQRSELNQAAKNPDLPARLLMTLIQARSSLARVVLPDQPVGIGGRWEARKRIESFGFELQQIDRYRLDDRAGDDLKLSVEIAESAPVQTVTFEQSGTTFELESLSVTARGELVVHLDRLEASGRVEGRATQVLYANRPEGREKIEVDSAFRVDVEVSEPAPEP